MSIRNLNFDQAPSIRPSSQKFITVCFLALSFWLVVNENLRASVAASLFAILLTITVLSRSLGICLTLAYLLLLGDVRRFISYFLGFPKFDLLLLVGPLACIWIGAPILARLRMKTYLSKLAVALMIIMAVQVINPGQGGITVGLGGAMFYMIPVLWFWIGREYGTLDLLDRVLNRVILPLGIAASVLGLIQTFFGFLPWEQAWLDTGALNLHIGDAVRAVGFSNSPPEYVRLLTLAAIVLLSKISDRSPAWALLLPLPVIANVLLSGRGAFLRLLVAAAVVWAVRGATIDRRFAVRFGAALTALLLVVFFAARSITSDGEPQVMNGTGALLSHQAGGLAHPLDEKRSTAGLHAMYLGQGLIAAISHPIGFGLGATTDARTKIGSDTDESALGGTEFDFGDMFVNLGLPGGLVYIAFVALTISASFQMLRHFPGRNTTALFAVLVSSFGGWLISGEYSSSAITFFLIGVVARAEGNWTIKSRPQLSVLTNPERSKRNSAEVFS